MKFQVDGESGQFDKAYRDTYRAISRAAKAVVTEAGARALQESRADLRAAGMSNEIVEGMRVTIYPKGNRTSVNSVAYLSNKLGFVGVFEEGATIRGRPLLWVPLPGTPKTIGGKPTTAKRYAAQVGKMFLIHGPSGRPILARREGKKLIPLFVGLDSVSIRKRLHIKQIADRIRDQIPEMFEREINSQI